MKLSLAPAGAPDGGNKPDPVECKGSKKDPDPAKEKDEAET